MRARLAPKLYGGVAQWLEQWNHNPRVGGSNPFTATQNLVRGENSRPRYIGRVV